MKASAREDLLACAEYHEAQVEAYEAAQRTCDRLKLMNRSLCKGNKFKLKQLDDDEVQETQKYWSHRRWAETIREIIDG